MESKTLFAKTPPVKLFFIASFPGAVSMLASALYQLVDGVLVGRGVAAIHAREAHRAKAQARKAESLEVAIQHAGPLSISDAMLRISIAGESVTTLEKSPLRVWVPKRRRAGRARCKTAGIT